MIMKTSFVCLLLIAYMGIFYYANRHLPIKATKIFSYYYISSVLLILFDLITLCTVNHMDVVPDSVNLIAHIIYFLTINTTVYLFFLYLRSLLENQRDVSREIRILQGIPFIITSILILVLPLDYIRGTYTNYPMGAKMYALYASVIIYNCFILYYCIRYWKLLNREKCTAILASVPIFIVVSLVNIFIPEALFTIVYVILTAVGVMMSNENSEKYLDKQTGMFNQYALEIVSNEYIAMKKKTWVVVFTLSETGTAQNILDWKQYIIAMEEIGHFCKREMKRQAFRIGDRGFVMLAGTPQTAEMIAESLMKHVQSHHSGEMTFAYKIISLSECGSHDVLMSRIVEICMDANKMVSYDFLTGVRNRNSFEKEYARLRSENRDMYYFIADLNNLKMTNDTMGHSAGDELLQAFARLLKEVTGSNGMVFRQGGDEFAILWQGTDVKGFLEVLEKKRIEKSKERMIPLSFAIGYEKLSDKDCMNKADIMMYMQKNKMKG
ncbi:MAG: diguanylate cyclase domain-containing protein [Wujia sp.]